MLLLYGTTNKSKFNSMKRKIGHLGIELLSLNDMKAEIPEIDECGSNPLENARIKAMTYYETFNIPVFSCDSGLYINDLDDVQQPGVHVRNINGNRLNDDEMIEYYSTLAKSMGGQMTARYKNAICLVLNRNDIHDYMGTDIASNEFIIDSVPHTIRREGFPLDSLSIHIQSRKYFYDMKEYTDETRDHYDGFTEFFRRTLK